MSTQFRTNRRTRKVHPLRGGLPTVPSVGRLGNERYRCECCGKMMVQGTEYEVERKMMCGQCYRAHAQTQTRGAREQLPQPNITKLLRAREYRPMGARETRIYFPHTRTARELAEM